MEKLEKLEYPKLKEEVYNAFADLLQTLPEETRGKVLSVLSFNHIPKGIINKEFFAKEFFPLETKEDFDKITKILIDAKKSLEHGRYYFEERPNKFPEKTNKIFDKGFSNLKDLLQLFSFVMPGKNESLLKIIDTEIKGKNSNKGNREAVCRILKRALVTYSLEKHINILPKASEGVLETFFPNIKTDILEKEKNRRINSDTIYDMPSVKDEVTSNIIFGNQDFELEEGEEEELVFFDENVSRIIFNFKHTGKGIDKVERKTRVTGSDINDLFRMKTLFHDDKFKNKEDKIEKILKHMHKREVLAEKSAKFMAKKLGYEKLEVVVESREINYLSEYDKKKYFKKIEGKENYYSGILKNMYLPNENEKMKKSADAYQNMSQKISYIDPKTGKYVFSFETQYATEKENKKNEDERQAGGHFMMELRNNSKLIFSMGGGKRKKEAIIKSIKRYLDWYRHKFIDTGEIDNFPLKLYGEFNETDGWESVKGSGKFRKGGIKKINKGDKIDNGIHFDNFRKSSLEEKVESIFNFLWAEGKIQKVPMDFPKNIYENRVSHNKTLKTSPYFCSNAFIRDIEKTVKKK